jgi:hypothetical protein
MATRVDGVLVICPRCDLGYTKPLVKPDGPACLACGAPCGKPWTVDGDDGIVPPVPFPWCEAHCLFVSRQAGDHLGELFQLGACLLYGVQVVERELRNPQRSAEEFAWWLREVGVQDAEGFGAEWDSCTDHNMQEDMVVDRLYWLLRVFGAEEVLLRALAAGTVDADTMTWIGALLARYRRAYAKEAELLCVWGDADSHGHRWLLDQREALAPEFRDPLPWFLTEQVQEETFAFMTEQPVFFPLSERDKQIVLAKARELSDWKEKTRNPGFTPIPGLEVVVVQPDRSAVPCYCSGNDAYCRECGGVGSILVQPPEEPTPDHVVDG